MFCLYLNYRLKKLELKEIFVVHVSVNKKLINVIINSITIKNSITIIKVTCLIQTKIKVWLYTTLSLES